MKLVINDCYGGFGLSPLAIKRIAELQGRPAYFFKNNLSIEDTKYTSITLEEAQKERLFFSAFDIPNPNEVFTSSDNWYTMTDKEKQDHNDLYKKHQFASLKIVEIPDGIEYEIEEYDGSEWVAEKHRTWH